MAHIQFIWCYLFALACLLREHEASTSGPSTLTADNPTLAGSSTVPGRAAPTTASTTSTRARCTSKTPVKYSERANHLRVLETEFRPSSGNLRALDLAFIMDRSQSIGSTDLTLTKQVITSLLNKLSELQYISIHQDYTRVAVVSFAGLATADIDGISSASQAVDACILDERIADLQVNKSFTPKSEVAKAMWRVMDILATSKESPDRPDPDQMVWIFFDGECKQDTPWQCMYKDKHIDEWAKEMRRANIRVFTAGIGQWLNSDEKERQLQNLAYDNDHYACATLWADIIPDLVGQRDKNPQAPLFNEIAEVYKSRCGPCPTGLECACDVTNRTYTCTDKLTLDLNPTPQNPSWLLPVAIGSSAGGFVLLLILLVALPMLAVKRQRERKEDERFFREQPMHRGPMLPPPSINSVPRRIVDPPQASENIYSNWMDGLAPEQDDTADRADSGNFEDLQDYENMQDYMNVDKFDHGMKYWPGELAYIKQQNSLKHMAVCSISNNCWAKTIGSPVTERDFREMEKIMRTAQTNPTNHKMKIGTNAYEVDRAKLATHQIHGSRFIHERLNEVVWIFKAYDYVIVGIANGSEDEKCESAVREIHTHLMGFIEPNMPNIAAFNVI